MILNRFLAAFIIVAVLMVFPCGIWSVAASGALLSAETYKNGLSSQNLYADIVPIALPAIARALEEQPAPPGAQPPPQDNPLIVVNTIRDAIGEEAWREVATLLVPPEWIQGQLENGIDQFFGQLTDEEGTPAGYNLDTGALRERLNGPEGKEAIDLIIDSAPDCTALQNSRLRATASGTGDAQTPICKPSALLRDTMQVALEDDFAEFASALEEIEASFNEIAGVEDENLANIRLGLQAFAQLLSLGYLCPIALLGLVVALTVRSLKAFSRWVGITIIVVGLFALLPLPFLRSSILEAVTAELSSSGGDLETRVFLARLASAMALSITDALSGPLLAQGFGLMLAGTLLLWLASRRGNRPSELVITSDGQLYSPQTGQFIGTITPSSSSLLKRPQDDV